MIAALRLSRFLRWAEIGALHTRLLSVGGIARRQLSVYVMVCVPPTKSREMLIEIRVSSSSYLMRFRGGAPLAQVTSKCLPDWGVSGQPIRLVVTLN